MPFLLWCFPSPLWYDWKAFMPLRRCCFSDGRAPSLALLFYFI
jgi:hypothetical protein